MLLGATLVYDRSPDTLIPDTRDTPLITPLVTDVTVITKSLTPSAPDNKLPKIVIVSASKKLEPLFDIVTVYPPEPLSLTLNFAPVPVPDVVENPKSVTGVTHIDVPVELMVEIRPLVIDVTFNTASLTTSAPLKLEPNIFILVLRT